MINIIKNILNYKWHISDIITTAILVIFISIILSSSINFPYEWNWSTTLGYIGYIDEETGDYKIGLFLIGLLNTFRLFFISMFIGITFGLLFAIFRISNNHGLNLLGIVYINFVRNIPPLVFLFVFYFFISEQIFPKIGLTPELFENFAVLGWLFGEGVYGANLISAGICLGLFESVFFAEIIRGAIKSIPIGQSEASLALGLNYLQTMRKIIIPQAFSKCYPSLAGQSIIALKNTSIASLISVKDLVFSGVEVVTSTRNIFEAWIIVAVIYFILCFTMTKFFNYCEKKIESKSI